jgi:hypothetical protein
MIHCFYRVMVDMLGLCCLPMVGMPLFLAWLNDDKLRGIDVCPLTFAIGELVMSIDDVDVGGDGGMNSADDCGNPVRRCIPICERTGVVNGLLLTSLSKLFSGDENCFAVYVEPKSLAAVFMVRCTGDTCSWDLTVWLPDVNEPRVFWIIRETGGRVRLFDTEFVVTTVVRWTTGDGCASFGSDISGMSNSLLAHGTIVCVLDRRWLFGLIVFLAIVNMSHESNPLIDSMSNYEQTLVWRI